METTHFFPPYYFPSATIEGAARSKTAAVQITRNDGQTSGKEGRVVVSVHSGGISAFTLKILIPTSRGRTATASLKVRV